MSRLTSERSRRSRARSRGRHPGAAFSRIAWVLRYPFRRVSPAPPASDGARVALACGFQESLPEQAGRGRRGYEFPAAPADTRRTHGRRTEATPLPQDRRRSARARRARRVAAPRMPLPSPAVGFASAPGRQFEARERSSASLRGPRQSQSSVRIARTIADAFRALGVAQSEVHVRTVAPQGRKGPRGDGARRPHLRSVRTPEDPE